MGGTTKESGWALFFFLLGFTVLGSAFAGSGTLGLIAGIVLIGMSFTMFKAARAKEDPFLTFARIREEAHRAAGRIAPPALPIPAWRRAPRLSEPWFC